MNLIYRPRILMTLFFAAVFAYVVYESADMVFEAKIYPWTIGLIGIVLICWQLFRDVSAGANTNKVETGADIDFTEEEASDEGKRRAVELFGWLYGFAAAIWLIGFHFAIPLMIFLYLLRHREGPAILIGMPLCAGLATWLIFDELLHLPFPPGLIIEWLGFD